MTDRLWHEKNHYFDEKTTVVVQKSVQLSQDNHDLRAGQVSSCCNLENKVQPFESTYNFYHCNDASFNLSDHSTADQMQRPQDVTSCHSYESASQLPIGIPLSKPPILASPAQVYTKDSLLRKFRKNKILHNGHEREEESSDYDSIMCDSKIYEVSEHKRDLQYNTRKSFGEMNPDERMFLEAACALSTSNGSAVLHTQLDEVVVAPTRRRGMISMMSKKGPMTKGPKTFRKTVSKTGPSSKQNPLGPPPFALPQIGKSVRKFF
jgi:hypothetical protein